MPLSLSRTFFNLPSVNIVNFKEKSRIVLAIQIIIIRLNTINSIIFLKYKIQFSNIINEKKYVQMLNM